LNINDSGELVVNVRYASGAVPISDAFAEIISDNEIIGVYSTSTDGKTEQIILPAGRYGLRVKKAGFFEEESFLVFIEEQMKSIMNIEMFPEITFILEREDGIL